MQNERDSHTLQPTAVVHEAFIRLFYERQIDWQNSNQFFFVVSREMRHVLTAYARARNAGKRGGDLNRVPLDDIDPAVPEETSLSELPAPGDALSELERTDDQLARLVELRYFAGMSIEEVSALLGVSISETGRLWRLAKSLLRSRLGG
jgi:RNA polymerase sigma factor (TIGR02999 family)